MMFTSVILADFVHWFSDVVVVVDAFFMLPFNLFTANLCCSAAKSFSLSLSLCLSTIVHNTYDHDNDDDDDDFQCRAQIKTK